jgi:cadmium resistance protein CadD (predicted permease)
MDTLTLLFLGQPLWMWLVFMTLVVGLLALDLGVLHRGAKEIGVRESMALSAFYIVLGLAFGGFVWWQLGLQAGVEYVTGFIVEKSLAMDNIFVIAMVFGFFAIPLKYQHRVLFWGILGVIVLRAIMIGLGATFVAEYSWVLYLFAAFLIATGIKMLWWGDRETDLSQNPLLKFMKRHFNVTDELHGESFFVKRPGGSGRMVTYITPLFLALVLIEIADGDLRYNDRPLYRLHIQHLCDTWSSRAVLRVGSRASPLRLSEAGACRVARLHRIEDLRRRPVRLDEVPRRMVARGYLLYPRSGDVVVSVEDPKRSGVFSREARVDLAGKSS